MKQTGAQAFVKALKEEHVDVLFAYPGGQAIDLFDALYDEQDITLILPRHEQGLIHAADGYARSSGNVGVCLVTSGPGATNLVTGIATANYDSVPLVCFTGQVPTHLIGNDAFQEVDIVGITRSICKYAVTVRKREELLSIIKQAFYIAKTGKPGVVVIDIPKDIQQAYGDDQSSTMKNIRGYNLHDSIHLGQLEKAMNLLKQAKKPIILAGGGIHIAHATEELKSFIQCTGLPVITTIRGKGAIPSTDKRYIGNLGIHGSYAANTAINQCDVLCSIGTRFNDRITGNIKQFAKHAKIIHIDIDPAAISRNIRVDIPIVADAKTALCAMLEMIKFPLPITNWTLQIKEWKEHHPIMMKADALSPMDLFQHINQTIEEAIITTDVGQNQLWATQFLELHERKKMLTSGGLGTMGYGLPAAIGAQIANPTQTVIAICGDGGIQMNIQELATAVVYELPIIICILNNGYLGNVRQWQELFYHKRYASTCLRYRKRCEHNCTHNHLDCPTYTPDFIALAESYGARAMRVTNKEDIPKAFAYARTSSLVPTIIECIIDADLNVMPIVPPGNTLDTMIMESTGETR